MTVGELIGRLAECKTEMLVLMEGNVTDDLIRVTDLEVVRVKGTWITERSTDTTDTLSVVLK
jgi:hypothetical protein